MTDNEQNALVLELARERRMRAEVQRDAKGLDLEMCKIHERLAELKIGRLCNEPLPAGAPAGAALYAAAFWVVTGRDIREDKA